LPRPRAASARPASVGCDGRRIDGDDIAIHHGVPQAGTGQQRVQRLPDGGTARHRTGHAGITAGRVQELHPELRDSCSSARANGCAAIGVDTRASRPSAPAAKASGTLQGDRARMIDR
jgi:hypothetical protein